MTQKRAVVLKRVIDIVGATLALLVLSPLLLAIAGLILLESGPPILYRGSRTGLNGRPFRIMKFRTMVVDAERLGGPSTALNDQRLTASGRFLRKYKVDELPQILNVLKGDMSLVGPRPQVKEYTDLYSTAERAILSVRPGLTDYASIEFIDLDRLLGDGDVDEKYRKEIEPKKNALRLRYVQEQSLLTDVTIIVRTILRLLSIPRLWKHER